MAYDSWHSPISHGARTDRREAGDVMADGASTLCGGMRARNTVYDRASAIIVAAVVGGE